MNKLELNPFLFVSEKAVDQKNISALTMRRRRRRRKRKKRRRRKRRNLKARGL
jgi:hypothetical protein